MLRSIPTNANRLALAWRTTTLRAPLRCQSSSSSSFSSKAASTTAPSRDMGGGASATGAPKKISLKTHAALAKYRFANPNRKNKDGSTPAKKERNLMVSAGIPFVLFSVLAAWVVSNAVDGKLKEMELSQGKSSQSIRQAKLEEEHEDMMERLGKIVETDFDNTKRIKRPNEILEERRLDRERRNAWHRRAWRAVTGAKSEAEK
jgi:hypothetical protein